MIKSITKNIKPGYKQTPVGIIPEDWEVKRFEELAKRSSDRFDPVKEHNKKDLELDSFEQGTGRILSVYDSKDYKSLKNCFNEGEILFGKLRPYLRKYWRATFNGVCSSEIWVFRNKKSVISEYLYLTLQTKYFISKSQITSGTKMPRADWSSVKNAKLPIPPLPEQERIASCLTTWDQGIEKLSQLIDAKKQQKKGLMQQLLTGENRLDGFTEEWEEVKLRELIKVQGGYAFKSKEFKNKGIPIVRISNLDAVSGLVSFDDIVYYDEIFEKQFQIQNGDIMIAMSGATTGKTAVYTFNEIAYLNQRVGLFKNRDKSKFHYSLLYSLVKTNYFENEITKMLSTGAQPNISSSEIESINIEIPSLEEQTTIAKVLTTADKEIELLENKLASFRTQKKGLMQVLLTGKKRLV